MSAWLSLPAAFSAWIGAFGSRLVDRVDHVHVRVLGEQVFHRLAGRLRGWRSRFRGRSRADRFPNPAPCRFGTSMPKPVRKPVSRRTSTEMLSLLMSSMPILASGGRRPSGPWPTCRSARRLRSCRWRRSSPGASASPSGVSSAITRTPGSAGVLEGRDDRVVRGGDQDALGARGDAVLDGCRSAGRRRRRPCRHRPGIRGRVRLALASAPSFIFTKKGLVLFLVIRQARSAAEAEPAISARAAAPIRALALNFMVDPPKDCGDIAPVASPFARRLPPRRCRQKSPIPKAASR